MDNKELKEKELLKVNGGSVNHNHCYYCTNCFTQHVTNGIKQSFTIYTCTLNGKNIDNPFQSTCENFTSKV